MQIPYTVEPRPETGLFNAKLGIWLFLASEVMLFGGRTGTRNRKEHPHQRRFRREVDERGLIGFDVDSAPATSLGPLLFGTQVDQHFGGGWLHI